MLLVSNAFSQFEHCKMELYIFQCATALTHWFINNTSFTPNMEIRLRIYVKYKLIFDHYFFENIFSTFIIIIFVFASNLQTFVTFVFHSVLITTSLDILNANGSFTLNRKRIVVIFIEHKKCLYIKWSISNSHWYILKCMYFLFANAQNAYNGKVRHYTLRKTLPIGFGPFEIRTTFICLNQ